MRKNGLWGPGKEWGRCCGTAPRPEPFASHLRRRSRCTSGTLPGCIWKETPERGARGAPGAWLAPSGKRRRGSLRVCTGVTSAVAGCQLPCSDSPTLGGLSARPAFSRGASFLVGHWAAGTSPVVPVTVRKLATCGSRVAFALAGSAARGLPRTGGVPALLQMVEVAQHGAMSLVCAAKFR